MKAGDVVYLRSGGPLMTIVNIIESGAYCTWFNENRELKTATFPLVILEVDEQE